MYGPKCSDCGKKRGTQKSARQNTSQQTHIIQGQLVFEAKPGKKHSRWDSDVFVVVVVEIINGHSNGHISNFKADRCVLLLLLFVDSLS